MRVKVNLDACIGCGACLSICPEVFSFNVKGFAQAITQDVNKDDEEKVQEAIEGCPTEAIYKISEEDNTEKTTN